MNIAICDDNIKHNAKLRKMLNAYARKKNIDKYNIFEFTGGELLLSDFSERAYDIIFLDVFMSVLNGFETAEKIREKDLDVDIIFVTNLTDDVQRGFDYNAKGYLYKEICQEEINSRMDKIISERIRKNSNAFRKIKLKNGGSTLLSLPRVLYFESNGHYVSAFIENKILTFYDKISDLANELKSMDFIRISRSHIVNLDHVFNISGTFVTLKKSNIELSVGRKYKNEVADALKKKEDDKWKI